jgi:hypothetical protein
MNRLSYANYKVTLFYSGGSISATAMTEIDALCAANKASPDGPDRPRLTGRRTEKIITGRGENDASI